MSSHVFQGNVIQEGVFHDYNIAGNITNAFALGEVGSVDEFFLVGMEPKEDSLYPSLTGNILDSEGNLLFQLRNNIIKLNPGNCSKIVGNLIGYEIHDSAGKLIFKVETVFASLPQIQQQKFVTTIKANFYNKSGELIFEANSGDPDEKIASNTKTLFGYSQGAFGSSVGMSQEEQDFLRFVFSSGNASVEPVRGLIENQYIDLNGKVFFDVTINNSQVNISTGNFAFLGKSTLSNNEYTYSGEAAYLISFHEKMKQNVPEGQ